MKGVIRFRDRLKKDLKNPEFQKAFEEKEVKMTNASTETIYKGISQLTNNEKIILFSKLMLEISIYIQKDRKDNIYDIKGVGKEVWDGMDAQEYVNRERASWK